MATGCAIRPATPDDVPEVFRLIRGLAEYERLADSVTGSDEALGEHLFGIRAYAEVLVAEIEGRLAGFALFFHSYSTFLTAPGLYLEDLFVEPAHRGRGIGTALLARVARTALDRRCGRLEWAVLDWNEPAIGFYRRHGTDVMPDWRICRVTGEALARLADTGRGGSLSP